MINAVKRSNKDDCEKYWNMAVSTRSEHEHERLGARTIRDDADRIKIHSVNTHKKPLTCYNVQKLGRYGICKTNPKYRDQQKPVKFGFCSRSCSVSERMRPKEVGEGDDYEEMDVTYFDEPPVGTDFIQGKCFGILFCIAN